MMSAGDPNLEERPRVPMMSAGDTNIDSPRQHFEAFCKEHYADRNGKTISKDKGQKIVRLLNNATMYRETGAPDMYWNFTTAFPRP